MDHSAGTSIASLLGEQGMAGDNFRNAHPVLQMNRPDLAYRQHLAGYMPMNTFQNAHNAQYAPIQHVQGTSVPMPMHPNGALQETAAPANHGLMNTPPPDPHGLGSVGTSMCPHCKGAQNLILMNNFAMLVILGIILFKLS